VLCSALGGAAATNLRYHGGVEIVPAGGTGRLRQPVGATSQVTRLSSMASASSGQSPPGQLPDRTQLLLVRHAEAGPKDPDEPAETVGGQSDWPLTARGTEQAVVLCERLRHQPITAIYVTPLRRTAETAKPLAEVLHLQPTVEPGLIEVYLGEWEKGLYRKNLDENHPTAIRMRAEGRFDVIPGAESNEHITERTSRAVGGIAARHPGELVLAVAHGGSIASVLAKAARAPLFSFLNIANTAVSSIVVDDNGWGLRRYNDTAHLEAWSAR
jgi:2,3-bisphosphoglycerate-dependent phosphoglycerate mutase